MSGFNANGWPCFRFVNYYNYNYNINYFNYFNPHNHHNNDNYYNITPTTTTTTTTATTTTTIKTPLKQPICLGKAGCDPYLLAQFAGIKVQTKHVAGLNVVLQKELQIPVMEPIMGRNIKLSLYDWNAVCRSCSGHCSSSCSDSCSCSCFLDLVVLDL